MSRTPPNSLAVSCYEQLDQSVRAFAAQTMRRNGLLRYLNRAAHPRRTSRG